MSKRKFIAHCFGARATDNHLIDCCDVISNYYKYKLKAVRFNEGTKAVSQ